MTKSICGLGFNGKGKKKKNKNKNQQQQQQPQRHTHHSARSFTSWVQPHHRYNFHHKFNLDISY